MLPVFRARRRSVRARPDSSLRASTSRLLVGRGGAGSETGGARRSGGSGQASAARPGHRVLMPRRCSRRLPQARVETGHPPQPLLAGRGALHPTEERTPRPMHQQRQPAHRDLPTTRWAVATSGSRQLDPATVRAVRGRTDCHRFRHRARRSRHRRRCRRGGLEPAHASAGQVGDAEVLPGGALARARSTAGPAPDVAEPPA